MNDSNDKIYKVYRHLLPKHISGKENDMIYIGITSQLPEKRWLNGNGYKDNSHFYNAICKYGWDSFNHDILLDCLTKEEAEQKEIEFIAKYKSANRCYGYSKTNGGNCTGTMLQETKDKISKANMGNKYALGHRHTEEAKRKMSEAAKGNQRAKGLRMPEHVKQILAESRKTIEFRKKLSEANKGKKHSEETKKKLSESHKGIGSKRVVCIETGIIYNSVKEASEKNMIKGRGHISACCKGTRRTAGGYHWCYENEYNDSKVEKLLNAKSKRCKPVLCIDNNKIYDSIFDAFLDTGISDSRISECCSGKCSHAGGLHWQYYKEVS